MKRSKEIITKTDLRKLYKLALEDMEGFFQRNPRYKQYKNKHVFVALCQGAALHYIDRKNGVKDFDVWFFYPRKALQLPYRRRGYVDFGKSKFGKRPGENHFKGRSIDVLMRADSKFSKCTPQMGIRNYLSKRRTKSAKFLAQKGVVGLYPDSVLGKVLWPVNSD